ncbi:MAG: glucose-1-phosphate thymidylyltransferase RfbA [Candidatus Omnitrophica bacterium]|jgi:glucose-1-phosphate thymidylyltransferase|nr:glucose-1-phosphate thymidylyltransferase RfbA [Candidatus Omnitrophota bacterium]
MKGIILAGGSGTRLYPLTRVTCKQLLPVYDKPMIYYPLSILMLAGIRDILIISTPEDITKFENLFGNGNYLGINIHYSIQPKPQGIAQSFIIGEKFIGNSSVCLILGDNIFFGHGLTEMLQNSVKKIEKSGVGIVYGYYVKDPERYGVIEFDNNRKVISIEEKPKNPKSNYAVVGLYFYDNKVIEIAKNIKPSWRNEMEITSVNQEYLKKNKLSVEIIGRGFAWLDMGTYDSLLEASNFVEVVEKRQGLKIACIEEIAYKNGWIDKAHLMKIIELLNKSGYGKYLTHILEEEQK